MTPNELLEISNAFRPGKAAGHNRIPISIIKKSIQIIAVPLAHIINLSISHGIVPDHMKIARVIPLFKAGDRSLFTNYRPISILPSFSKFLEKVVYNRLYNYLGKLEILCDNQFGFRKNHSTSLALLLIAMNMPLAFSLIFLRPLIPSIIIFCLTNSNTMVYVAWLWTGLEATSPTGCNSFNLTVNAPLLKLSAVVSPRDLFWASCFSCSILMI